MKSRFKAGRGSYLRIQNILYFRFPSMNVNIKIFENIFSPFVLYEYRTLCLTLRELHRLKVLGNMMLRRIFELKKTK